MSDELPALVTAVRHHTDALPVTPAPWPAIRRRHGLGILRRGALAVTGAVAVAAAAVAVVSGTASLTSTQREVRPAVPWPGAPELAAGSPWAVGFETELVRQLGAGAGTTRELLYAADVDGLRVAFVHTHEGGPGPSDLYRWAHGPAGAAPDRMTVDDSAVDPATAYAVSLPAAGPEDDAATVLVLGPAGAQLSAYAYDGVDEAGEAFSTWVSGTQIAPGVYRARIAVPVNGVQLRLQGGGVSWQAVLSGAVQAPPVQDAAWWAAASPGLRGDAAAGLPDKLLIQQVYNQLALPSSVPGSRVLWTMRDGANRQSAVALRTAGGGWAVAGIESRPRVTDAQGGYTEGSTTLAAAPRPEGDPAALVLAWYLESAVTGGDERVAAGDRLAVVGPPGATQVRPDGGEALPLPGGAGLVRRAGVRSVEFLDATGRSLGVIDVAKPWNSRSHLHAP